MKTPSQGIPATVGGRIAEARERRGWTQKYLAEMAKISVTFLSEVENNRRAMGSDALLRVADALGLSVDYVLKGQVEPSRTQRPLVIPPELAEAAEEKGWSLGETTDTLKAHQLVLARRSQETKPRAVRTMSKHDWIQLHDRLFHHE